MTEKNATANTSGVAIDYSAYSCNQTLPNRVMSSKPLQRPESNTPQIRNTQQSGSRRKATQVRTWINTVYGSLAMGCRGIRDSVNRSMNGACSDELG